MEVAGQWRKEWAGTAEYGKVTEGGVTRRIARAMEVLNATGPGARVRVMRAAYHSSAGPGIPASSYMMHSSRRVITSGFNYTDPPSLPSIPTVPLEISSTPLEMSCDSQPEHENYKVTEPDDIEISEPSKWRGSRGTGSIRMPSEESSSTDNASIIDLDPRSNRNLHRKYSYDSESSDVQWNKKTSSRVSPLLDAPTTLNTLKYKYLLNNSSDWNNRRKSYSFEDTKIPVDEMKSHRDDTHAMDSSTDSGICKSTEVVNDHIDDRPFERRDRQNNNPDESFKDWLNKNRSNNYYKGPKFKPSWEHDVVIEDPVESNITVQSTGKVSITLPIKIEKYDESLSKQTEKINDDHQRKTKKVEFCKTELHFAAESGKVNIIATDDKPPPSNDFRKRRNVFVPIDIIDKPITLFGDKTALSDQETSEDVLGDVQNEFVESDENTAATKSILKNKIPKPKPYLLGENMAFGSPKNLTNNDVNNESGTVLKAVSLINRQLEPQNIYDDIQLTPPLNHSKSNQRKNFWATDEGPTTNSTHVFANEIIHKVKKQSPVKEIETSIKTDALRMKFESVPSSTQEQRVKARQLRESDLTYFGVDNEKKKEQSDSKVFKNNFDDSAIEDIFRSVRLIQRVSSSVCNSEAESDDAPEYQNFKFSNNYTPVPKPRILTKYDDKPNEIEEIQVLKPIIEHIQDETSDYMKSTTRRSKSRRHELAASPNRSLSEPPKRKQNNKHSARTNTPSRSTNRGVKEVVEKETATPRSRKISEENIPIYENLKPGKIDLIYDKKRSSPKRSVVPEVPQRKLCVKSQETNNDKELIKRKNHEKSTLKEHNAKETSSKMSSHNAKKQRELHNDEKQTGNARDLDINKNKRKTSTTERKEENGKSSPRTHYPVKKETTKVQATNERKKSPVKNIAELAKYKKSNTDTQKEPNPLNKIDQNTIVYEMKSMQIKNDHKDANGKRNRSKSPRRREYVINYDDKNGTVSSVCKVTTSPGGSYRKKKISKEILRDSPKEHLLKPKTINKIALRK